MPGEMQLVEGKVERVAYDPYGPPADYLHVPGLQEALEKWVGRKVSITIEDVTE